MALADPSKSGSAVKAFEMVIQQQMNLRASELLAQGETPTTVNEKAPSEGWDRAMRLITSHRRQRALLHRLGVEDSARRGMGDAAAGMCIDFYGRFQSESTAPGGAARLGFSSRAAAPPWMPIPSHSCGGASSRARAQVHGVRDVSGRAKDLEFKVGSPGGPERYALRRLPILPEALRPRSTIALRSDPDEQPYEEARAFDYHAAWTGSLFRSHRLHRPRHVRRHQARARRCVPSPPRERFPSRGRPLLFDDVELVDYRVALGPVRSALGSSNPVEEVIMRQPARRYAPQAISPGRPTRPRAKLDVRKRDPFADRRRSLAAIFLLCFLFWPLVESLRGAFFDPSGAPTLTFVILLFQNPIYIEGFVNALGVAAASTLLASIIGFPVALSPRSLRNFPGKRIIAALIALPLMVPPFVGAIGIKQLLGQAGALNALLIDAGIWTPLTRSTGYAGVASGRWSS